jgi:hypothetical protein
VLPLPCVSHEARGPCPFGSSAGIAQPHYIALRSCVDSAAFECCDPTTDVRKWINTRRAGVAGRPTQCASARGAQATAIGRYGYLTTQAPYEWSDCGSIRPSRTEFGKTGKPAARILSHRLIDRAMCDETLLQEGCWIGNTADAADGGLATSLVERANWPVHRASLAAPSDLGLRVTQLARYFSVDPSDVRAVLFPPLGPRRATAPEMQVSTLPVQGSPS